MTTEVHHCRVGDTLERVAQNLWDHDCGALPVVDRHGQTVGMITDRDVCMAAYTTGRPLATIPVMVAASHGVHSVTPDDSIEHAESVMKMHRVRRLPVIDIGGNIVGMLSLADVVRHAHPSAPPPPPAEVADALDADRVASTLAVLFRSHDPRAHPMNLHTLVGVRGR
jgi:CBS-domain-containing membrane protein